MVDMHMRDDQRLDAGQGELDIQPSYSSTTIDRSLVTLEQAAIDQQAMARVHM